MSELVDSLLQSLDQCMLRDRHRLKAALRKSKKKSQLDRIQKEVSQSIAIAQARKKTPVIEYPMDLPIADCVAEIKQAISDNPIIVVAGETGSGKTTQLPKILMDMGYGVFGSIGHTQPRRIAARAVANRISEELGVQLGSSVGFKVRFDDVSGPESRIKLMTDGILLAELVSDPWLNNYDCLIVDEAHERSLNIDFILGYLKRLLKKRKDLKVIITSATLNTEHFSAHFNDAPIVEVSGRTYPVEIRYRDPIETDTPRAIELAVKDLWRGGSGDVLVFLPGERDIKEVQKHLSRCQLSADILPLFGRLSTQEQQKIFKPTGRRRMVLSTNIAETSLTVPGIRFVVDTGTARVSRYSYRTKVQRLPIEKISQASANQRAGRCGRVADGICVRLYSQEDFDNRMEYTEPELLRTNLASVILQMALLRLGDVESFEFVDKPDSRLIRDGYRLLRELRAIDDKQRITELGKKIARLPVDPRFGRMLLEAERLGVAHEVRVIVAGLSIQDPRERPLERAQAADQKHSVFHDKGSDFLTWLNLWNQFRKQRKELTRREFREWCYEHFLAIQRLFEWADVYQQLSSLQKSKGSSEDVSRDHIHKALLVGLLSHFGTLGESGDYDAARGGRFQIFPGSVLAKSKPKWIVAANLVETSRLFARTVTAIRPEWLEQAGKHLINRSYSDFSWSKKTGQVMAMEQVSLYGVVIVGQRRVGYSQINPEQAQPIFLTQALVVGELGGNPPKFLQQNLKLRDEIENVENKQRRRNLLLSDDRVAEFYAARIPKNVASRKTLLAWLAKQDAATARGLLMERGDLTGTKDELPSVEAYPDTFALFGNQLRLRYQYGASDADGVTLEVPIPLLPQLEQIHLDYAVPGMLEQKLIALIKGLPKAQRKNFVPAPDFAKACIRHWRDTEVELPLLPNLSQTLAQMTGVRVEPDQWPDLPDHLRLRLVILDEAGSVVRHGRDLEEIKSHPAIPRVEAVADHGGFALSQKLTSWTFPELPKEVVLDQGSLKIKRYPALKDQTKYVDQVLCDSLSHAATETRLGLQRLFVLALPQQCKNILDRLKADHELVLACRNLSDVETLGDEVLCAVAEELFLNPPVTSKADFDAALSRGRSDFLPQAEAKLKQVKNILILWAQVSQWCHANASESPFAEVAEDIQSQLDGLIFEGFVRQTSGDKLARYPVYLKAVARRQNRVAQNLGQDSEHRQVLADLSVRLSRAQQLYGSESYEEIRWMLEEFRVSLFAQDLKTAVPVSAKRIIKKLESIG